MRLNVNGCLDVKNERSSNLLLDFYSSKSFFLFFVQKWTHYVEFHMYNVTNY